MKVRQALQVALWQYAFYRLSQQDTDAALRATARAERFGELMPAHKVFKGNVLLIAQRYDDAKALWSEIVDRYGSDLTPNTRYAFLTARANLHALAGNLAMCSRDERDAADVRCSRLITRLLPGPNLIEANDR